MKEKDWIKKLKPSDIRDAYTKYSYKTPADHVDESIIQKIDDNPVWDRMRHEDDEKAPSSRFMHRNRVLLAAAAFVILLCAAVITLLISRHPYAYLMLSRVSGTVSFSKDGVPVSLSAEDPIEEKLRITTDQNAAAWFGYGDKTVMEVYGTSEILVATLSADFIMIDLSEGKIKVDENTKIPGAATRIRTPDAVVYAKGTVYTVEYDRMRTMILSLEGTVVVEARFKARESFILKEGEELILEGESVIRHDVEEKEWDVTEVYRTGEDIIGFDAGTNRLVALTEHSLLCFDENGVLVWMTDLSKDTPAKSVPAIVGNEIFISSLYSLLVFDLLTGKYKKTVDLVETVAFNFRLTPYRGTLYIPVSAGLFLYDLLTGSLDARYLPFPGATSPLFINDTMIVASYFTKTVAAYDLDGKSRWSRDIGERSYCPPALVDDRIIAGSYLGGIYRFSRTGEIMETMKAAGDIRYITGKDGILFASSQKNICYMIDADAFTIEREITEATSFSYISGCYCLVGSKKGRIFVYDMCTKEEGEITLQYDQDVVSLHSLGTSFYAGLAQGAIVKLDVR